MPGQPDDQSASAISARIPNEQKEAMLIIADERSTRRNRVPLSEIIREFVEDELVRRWDDLPEEAKDILDEDLKANAGEGTDPRQAIKGGESP